MFEAEVVKLPGMWDVTIIARGQVMTVHATVTDVVIYRRGPWVTFKDAGGRIHYTSQRTELRESRGRMQQ